MTKGDRAYRGFIRAKKEPISFQRPQIGRAQQVAKDLEATDALVQDVDGLLVPVCQDQYLTQ
ncbi:MAG: hypothetical protein KDN05_09855, partial [Verrucomicrobiae bacterium]|nr:hypothetical protein [Verrucomicrobiae bacterium]